MKSNFFTKYFVNFVLVFVIVTIASIGVFVGDTVADSKPSAIYKGSSKDKVSLMVNVYWGTDCTD